MAIIEDEPSVRKADARSGQWVDITMKKEDEIFDLKKVIKKWTCSKVTLNQLLSKQETHNIVKALGGKGRRKENNFSKEVVFTKADEYSSQPALEITSDFETDCDTLEPLPALPNLIGTKPSGTSNNLIPLSDLTSNMDEPTLNNSSKRSKKSSVKVSQTYVITKTKPKEQTVQIHCSEKKASPSTEQLLLTLMEEVKGIKDHIKIPSITSLSGSQASSSIP
ncbi:hypothetical protein Tco_0237658 [Tanacetum coccineum]